MRNYDLEFLKRFSMVIGLLALVTLGLILLAKHLHDRLPAEVSPTAAKRTAERIHPAGAVYAGDTGAAAQAAAAAAAAAKASSQVAYGGTTDGAVIFQNLCGACHTGGVGGAPTWTTRTGMHASPKAPKPCTSTPSRASPARPESCRPRAATRP